MYPGNHTESDMLYVPRNLKTRPGAPQTHLAYITDDEAEMLQRYKPGTPHEGAAGIPNYDTWGIDTTTGAVTGGSTADTGGAWSGDVSYGNQGNQGNQNNQNNQGNIHQDETIIPTDTIINTDATNTVKPLTEEQKIWQLATEAAASNPGYAKSYEGQRLIAAGINPGDDAWIQHFGLPQIISTGTYQSPAYTGEFDDNWASAIKTTGTGDFIYSGQGQHLMDQYDNPTGSYEDQVADYYAMRDAEMAQQTGGDQGYGYGYGHGSGGGGGGSMAGMAHPRSFYKGLPYQDFSGKEVHKMLSMDQKVDAANILSGLSQGAQAFAMDPKARGIMAVLTA